MGVAVNTDDASLARQLLTSGCAAPNRLWTCPNLQSRVGEPELSDVPTDTWLAGARAVTCTKGRGFGLNHKTLTLGTAKAPIAAPLAPWALPRTLPHQPGDRPESDRGLFLISVPGGPQPLG